jgi:threonine aldolase
MANTVGLMLNAAPGSTVVTQQGAHVLVSEANAGCRARWTVDDERRRRRRLPAADRVGEGAGNCPDAQRARVALVVLENTHNRTGGVPLPPEYVAPIVALAHEAGARAHLDGARIFNAASALATSARRPRRGDSTQCR